MKRPWRPPIACFFCEEHPHTYPSAWLCENPWCFPTFFPRFSQALLTTSSGGSWNFSSARCCCSDIKSARTFSASWALEGAISPVKLFEFNLFNLFNYHVNRLNMVKPAPANAPTGQLGSSLLGGHIGLVSHLRILMKRPATKPEGSRCPIDSEAWKRPRQDEIELI